MQTKYFASCNDLHIHFDKERAYPLNYWKRQMIEHGLTVISLLLAVRSNCAGYFYCKMINEAGEKGNCGDDCKFYSPCNYINGKCKYAGYLYENSNKSFTLTKKGRRHYSIGKTC